MYVEFRSLSDLIEKTEKLKRLHEVCDEAIVKTMQEKNIPVDNKFGVHIDVTGLDKVKLSAVRDAWKKHEDELKAGYKKLNIKR